MPEEPSQKEESKEETKEDSKYRLPRFIFKKQEISHFSEGDLHIKPIPIYSEVKKETSLCFRALGPRQAGRLNAAKAKALGVPMGKKLGLLKNGESVELEDGTVIHPHQVLQPPEPAEGAFILFIPSVEYLKSLVSSSEFTPYFADNLNSKEQIISVVYHSCPVEVLEDPRYIHFIHKFSPNTLHLLDCRTPV